jgi:hypothetical protein
MSEEQGIPESADLELLGGVFDGEEEQQEQSAIADDGEQEQQADDPVQAHDAEIVPPKRDTAIPRARFDEVNAKLHAAREETEQLRAALAAQQAAQGAPTATIDLDELESAYYDAVESGDKDAARQIRKEINGEIYARAKAAGEEAIGQQLAARESESQFQQVVAQTLKDFPFLDIQSADANSDAIADVVEWRDMYIAQGRSPADALSRAVKKVTQFFPAGQQNQPDPPPIDRRKQQAIANAARTAGEQPPRFDSGVGNRTIPVSTDILSNPDKWAKAPESERQRMLQ